jgi:hypothetical protein
MRKFRVRDGKVVKVWNEFDFLKLFQQMGVARVAGGRKYCVPDPFN